MLGEALPRLVKLVMRRSGPRGCRWGWPVRVAGGCQGSGIVAGARGYAQGVAGGGGSYAQGIAGGGGRFLYVRVYGELC